MAYKYLYKLSANAIANIIRLARFAVFIFIFYVMYRLLLEQLLDGSKQVIPIFLLWLLSSYIVVPRIHRILTKYYLPNYYVGRIRSPSGLLSDPINLAFFGNSKDIHRAMKKAGWAKADKLNFKTAARAAYSSFFSKSYPNAPVGNMFLFNRVQDFAYEQQVGGSPNERHHIRFWRTANNWRLPGGHKADWLAAATYDTHVGLKIATGQIDHFIHQDIDEERDYVISTLEKTSTLSRVEVIENFTNAYHDRSNGGDSIKTDGSLPFVYLEKP